MNRTTVRNSMPALILAATALPAGSAWAAAHHASASHTFRGSVEQSQQWGPIQVAITVKNKKITRVKVTSATHTARSSVIQDSSLPILKSETLQAQSANINSVSGATDTSGAYIHSLQAAIKVAKQHRAMK